MMGVLAMATSNDAVGTTCKVPGKTGTACTIMADSALHMNDKGIALLQSMEGWYPTFYVDAVGIKTIGE